MNIRRNSKARYRVHRQNNLFLFRIFWSLSIAIIVFSALYMYFVGQTIFAVAERENLEDTIVETETEISELELALIEKKRLITREFAVREGFVEVENTTFVKRDPDTRLSLRTE